MNTKSSLIQTPRAANVLAGAFLIVGLGCLMAPLGQLEVAGPMYLDKLVHAALFAGANLSLAILAPSLKAPIVSIVALAFGGLTELAQACIRRDASWLDWAADAVGIGIFLLAALILRAHAAKFPGLARTAE